MTVNIESLHGRPVIVGAGIAGLAAALWAAPLPVVVLNKGAFGSGSTAWAQGGIAAAIGSDDSPALHAADTLAVGGGLVDPAIANLVTAAGPRMIEQLQEWGVRFDTDRTGQIAPGLEAGHSRRRIVHAGGDATGSAIIAALTERARNAPSITLLDRTSATSIAIEAGRVSGIFLRRDAGDAFLPSNSVVLATGGMGQLYGHTTNPPGALGDGLLLAARAGAVLRDMEFVQFHPTALNYGNDPMPLATEALRGNGARLVTGSGRFVTAGLPAGDLGPRDMVARAIWKCIEAGEQVFLDCRGIADFHTRFPTVSASCRKAGFDPLKTPVPVRPAAHYHMGGVEVDGTGHTSLPGLWACGEVASTGLHGANRLASNSLLEAVVFAELIGQDLQGVPAQGHHPGRERSLRDSSSALRYGRDDDKEGRNQMDRYAGVIRDEAGLEEMARLATPAMLADDGGGTLDFMIAIMALTRRESRGAHYRSDHPQTDAVAQHSRITLAQARELALGNLG